jgi:hypothetical protein
MKSFQEMARELSSNVSGVRMRHQHTDQKETEMQHDTNLIPNRQKPVYLEAYITNITKGGAAFAREIGGMRDIFIPVAVVERTNLSRADHVIVTTVPNKLYESWSPDLGVLQPAQLFAIHVVKADETTIRAMQEASADEQVAAPPKKPSIKELILEALKDGPFRAAALAKKIGGEQTYTVFDRLCEMHNEGLVARANLYSRGGQKQASCVIWALDINDLLPALDEDDNDDLPDL